MLLNRSNLIFSCVNHVKCVHSKKAVGSSEILNDAYYREVNFSAFSPFYDYYGNY